MYRIVLACNAYPLTLATLPRGHHRRVHSQAVAQNVTWLGTQLLLQADNDFDSKGLALDEFGDAISACIHDASKAVSRLFLSVLSRAAEAHKILLQLYG